MVITSPLNCVGFSQFLLEHNNVLLNLHLCATLSQTLNTNESRKKRKCVFRMKAEENKKTKRGTKRDHTRFVDVRSRRAMKNCVEYTMHIDVKRNSAKPLPRITTSPRE